MDKAKERKRIAKDPFHQKILEALAGPLDPQVFEACMGDLLQNDFPGLVPMPGGNDAGMDAAVATGKGEPFPLVCTVEENVYGNLERSLDSILERGLSSRLVALATSRTLTPPQTRNLHSLAREKGFTLLQVFERSAVANRLYRNSVWCKRLLDLTGTPSALSVVPLSRRPFLDIDLVGREADAEWLRSSCGDRMIVGEPGSGKTYLFSWLIHEGWPALFLVNDNDTEIANAVRDQKPEIVIVDEAHLAPPLLDRLRRLRQEIQEDFDIVASTWPGAKEGVMKALGCPESHAHELGPLPRSKILEIIRQVGVEAADEALRTLVDQSSNKPGLAVTIAKLWLQGDWQKVLDGTVLNRTILTLFRDLVGSEVAEVLASFSLGGSAGVRPASVGKFLKLRPGDIDRIAAGLSAGGVLSEDGQNWLVRPEPLRSALLREVFFSGRPTAHDYRKLLGSVPDYDRAVEAILAARLYGGVIDSNELRELVARSKSPLLWRLLAAISAEDAHWALQAYRGNVLDISGTLLEQIPLAVIPRFFEWAAASASMKERTFDAPMSMLASWVQDIAADSQEWVRRRRMVTQAAKRFLLDGGVQEIGVHGICIGLSPTVRGGSVDPGMGTTVTFKSGLLPPGCLREIESIWEEAEGAIQEIDAGSWSYLSHLLWDWLYPEYAARGGRASEDQRCAMRDVSIRMLDDLARRATHSPGLKAELERLATDAGLSLNLKQDDVFRLLYSFRGANSESGQNRQAIESLAAEWAKDLPQEVAGRIAFYEQEAQKVSHGWLQNTPDLCRALAELTDEPEEWLQAFLNAELPRHVLSPCLERIVALRRTGWDERLGLYLDHESLAWTAVSLVLRLPDPPPALLSRALDSTATVPLLVETLCLQGKVPIDNLRRLLCLPDREVALAAAVGQWCANPRGAIREEIRSEWRAVILQARVENNNRNVGSQYWLRAILGNDPDLALEWLRTRLQESELPTYFMGDSPISTAARVLRKDQKESLLEELEPAKISRSLIPVLVGRDVDLYRRLLNLDRLKAYHLKPVGGPRDPDWEGFALAALDAGYAPERIAQASLGTSHSWAGSGIEYWERWDQAFAAFEGHPRADLREVVLHGRERVQANLADSRRRQKHFELHGLSREG